MNKYNNRLEFVKTDQGLYKVISYDTWKTFYVILDVDLTCKNFHSKVLNLSLHGFSAYYLSLNRLSTTQGLQLVNKLFFIHYERCSEPLQIEIDLEKLNKKWII
jgi:hypothetical protein